MSNCSFFTRAVWVAMGLILLQCGCGGDKRGGSDPAQDASEVSAAEAGETARRPSERSARQLDSACNGVLPSLKDLLSQLSLLQRADATEPFVLSFQVVRKFDDHSYEARVFGRQVIVQTQLVDFETTGQATLSVIRESSKKVELLNGVVRDVPYFREAVSAGGALQLSPLEVSQQRAERLEGIQQLRSMVILRLMAANQQSFSIEDVENVIDQSAARTIAADVRAIDSALKKALEKDLNAVQFSIVAKHQDALALFLDAKEVKSAIRKDGAGLIPALAELDPSSEFLQQTYAQLVELGANINDGDLHGSTALHHAVAGKELKLIEWLLENGADANVADDAGKTPLILAVEAGGRSELYKPLLKAGADPTLGDSDGNTPLHFAAAQTSSPLLDTLLGYVDQCSIANSEGRTPLHIACEKYHYKGISLLLEKGASRCAKDNDGIYPLSLLKQDDHRGEFATMQTFDADSGSVSTVSTSDAGWIVLTTENGQNVFKRFDATGADVWAHPAPTNRIELLQSGKDDQWFALMRESVRDHALMSFDRAGKVLWHQNVGRSRPVIREDNSFGFISAEGTLEIRDAANRGLCSIDLGKWASHDTPFQFNDRIVVIAGRNRSRLDGLIAYSTTGDELWKFKPFEENADVTQHLTIARSGRIYTGLSNRKHGTAVYCLDDAGNELWKAPVAYQSAKPVELPSGEVIVASDQAQCFDDKGKVVWSVPGRFSEVGVLPNQGLAFLVDTDFGFFSKVTLDGKGDQKIQVGRVQSWRLFDEGLAHLHRDGIIKVVDLLCW